MEGKKGNWVWLADAEGTFTVKSAFHLLQGLDLEEPIAEFEKMWQAAAPSSIAPSLLRFGIHVINGWGSSL